MIADIVNGLFEATAGLFVINNCRCLLRDKSVKGVSVLSTGFFTAWGIWNLYYYPSLSQWMSFFGGLLIVVSNVLWIILAIRYRELEPRTS